MLNCIVAERSLGAQPDLTKAIFGVKSVVEDVVWIVTDKILTLKMLQI